MKECISALMDGELDERAAGEAIDALPREGEALECWRIYHLISDGMRDTRLLSAGFAARVSQRLERARRQRARVGAAGDDQPRGVRQQLAQHRGGVLVVEDRDDRRQRPPAEVRRQRAGEGLDAAGVVRAVEDRRRVVGELLEAAGHERGGGRRAHRVLVERAAIGLGRRAREREVAALELPARAERHARVRAGDDQPRPGACGRRQLLPPILPQRLQQAIPDRPTALLDLDQRAIAELL